MKKEEPKDVELPEKFNDEKYYDRMSDANKSNIWNKILRFNFDCRICGKRYYDYRMLSRHIKIDHSRIYRTYKGPKEYKQAVKDGLEEDLWKKSAKE